jgi:methylglyoxal synthase/pSer/pThr/pTyr-binding forkhead associated (FHA) protein
MKIKVYYVELDPKLEDREFDLGSIFKLKNECTIGRSPESDLVLDSPDLSRSHGRIISKNGNYYFIDLGSRNGSLFNDLLTTPSQEYLLNHDDTIRIGDFVLKIEEEEEQAATVFKVIDPALFKRKQTPVEDIPRPEVVVPPILPVVELAQNAALTPPPIHDDEVPVVPVVEPYSPTALVVDEFDDRSTFVQLGENHPPAALIVDESDDNDDEVPVVPVVEPHSPTALVVDEFDDRSTFVQLGENHPPAALIVDESDDNDNEVPVVLVVEPHPPTALVVEELDETNIEFEPSSSVPIGAITAENTVELNTPNKRFGAELLKQKQIVLIAHDEKIADLVELIDRNKDFLVTCLTISWASISDSLRKETGMVVSKEIANGAAGGYQALAGLINSGDVLAVIFLRDLFAQNQAGKANEEAMLRLCNINEILLGTNIATADAIVHYLQS